MKRIKVLGEIYLEIEALVIKKTDLKDQDEKDRNTILIIDGLSRLFSSEINGFTIFD